MILLTGGTGFLGSHLLFHLVKAGEKVRAIRRTNANLKHTLNIFRFYTNDPESIYDKIEWVYGDVLDCNSLLDAMQGVDYVYHTAALVSFDSKDKYRIFDVNVRGTINMLNVAEEIGIKKFCYVSSIASLGNTPDNEFISEETHWNSSRNKSIYSTSKWLAEMEVWRAINEGLNAVIINPSVILGVGNWNQGSPATFKNINKGLKYYTLGTNGFVDVKDVVNIMIKLMQSDISNERFILNSENLNYQEIFTLIAKDLGGKPPSKYASKKLLSLAWRLEAIRAKILCQSPKITKETVMAAHNKIQYSNQKIKETLGVEFISIEKTVQEVADYFKKDSIKKIAHKVTN